MADTVRRTHRIVLFGNLASPIRSLHAGLGGAVAVFFVFVSASFVGHGQVSELLVASMGASAVLLFSVPDAPLSQPWNVIGGQTLSAAVGVTCAQWIGDPFLAAGIAVGGAIAVMSLLGCIHPPGGATALSAVVSGPAVQALGFRYVLTPVLLNTMVILAVAILFHLPRKKYPLR